MATVGTFRKPCVYAAGSLGRNPKLLPHQGALRSGGSHQWQHQNPSSKGTWLQESRLSTAQGPTHGLHQDRIHRSSESRLKCGSLLILVQSRKVYVVGLPSAPRNLIRKPTATLLQREKNTARESQDREKNQGPLRANEDSFA